MKEMSPQDDFNLEGTHVVEVDIKEEMEKSYLDYSMSVIVGRALPDVRDGLKPVHRRILYRMHEMHLRPENAYRKCADIVGGVLGSYHPHGDASVYDALVRMAQDFSLRHPLVDGHGNFGSIDNDPAAAYRYTEARLSKISTTLLTEINEETVDMQPNYDDRLLEPKVLPARFPNLLVNGSSGIAVGMATNIPPHNLGETMNAVAYLIDHPEAETADLMEHIKGPDFPTAGIIMGRGGIYNAYHTGRGKIVLRARTEFVELPNGRIRILVTEIPYQVNKSKLIKDIADLVNNKRIEGVSFLLDESSNRVGIKIRIDLKRDANPDVVLNSLFQYTQLQVSVGVILLAIENGQIPKVMTLKEILTHYIEFQKEIITRRSIFRLKKAQERAHLLEALYRALDIIDDVISTIRASKDQPTARENLMEKFDFDFEQASAIVAMRLGQLSGLEREKIETELFELRAQIEYLNDLLQHEEKVLALVKEEGQAISGKYSGDRRTEILNVSGTVDMEDLIPEEDCVVTLTHFGYMKRQPADVYKTQHRGGRGVSGMTRREDDFVEELFVSSSHDYVMFFTDKGKMFRLKCYQIPEGSRSSRGINLVNLLSLEKGEQVKAMVRVQAEDILSEDHYITMVTEKGIIKRTALTAFKNVRSSGVIAIVMDEDDMLAFARLTRDENELVIATRFGKAIRFLQSEDLRVIGRVSRGVKAITLDGDDIVVGMAVVDDSGELLTITENGYGRRTKMSEYRRQKRGGKGSINYKVSEEKGDVVAVRTVIPGQDIIMIADNGVIIRIDAEEINSYSRYSSGVRVMRVGENTRIVTFACVEKEDEECDVSSEDGAEVTAENVAEDNIDSSTEEID